jgi:hypothetical protein
MKKIDTTQIVSATSKQPFTGRSLKFLQDALDEDKAAIVKTLITSNLGSYSLSTPYVISGCVYDSVSLYGVTAGEIFYGGKFYETTALANDSSTNIPRFILTLSQDATADPVVFTDSVSKNVHNIYKYVATDVASGGDFTAADLVSLYGVSKIAQQITQASFSTSSATYVDVTSLTYTTPNDGVTRTYKLSFLGDAELSAASGTTAGVGGKFQIYNDTDATSLDIKRLELSVIFPSGSGDVVGCFSINCGTIISIAPNKTIKCRTLNDADGVTIKEAKFLIEEM